MQDQGTFSLKQHLCVGPSWEIRQCELKRFMFVYPNFAVYYGFWLWNQYVLDNLNWLPMVLYLVFLTFKASLFAVSHD